MLITGGGPTAVLMMIGAFAAGASKVFMTEILPKRLNRLKALGTTEVFNPLNCNLEKELLDRTQGIEVDIATECRNVQSKSI